MTSLRTGPAWLATLLALAAALVGCGAESSGGPELSELETVAVDLAGHRTDARCTIVPVLLGGRVRDEIDVADEFSIIVDATRDRVSVLFDGVNESEQTGLEIDAAQLQTAFNERIEIETTKARHFVVEFSSRCDP